MKLTKTLVAKDTTNKITVNITIESSRLMRDEARSQIETLTGSVMQVIPDTQFFGGKLSQIRVK